MISHRFADARIIHLLAVIIVISALGDLTATAQEPAKPPRVPEGFTIELAASSPLVEHPMMACFDERGRLFIAEAAGKNLERRILDKELPNFIRMIEDTDGDGKFDKSTIFADKLTFPQGVLWHEGSIYCASSGAVWKFTDTNHDGVADVREKIVSDFGYTGNAADVKGPFLGPDGRLYILEGRHGHEVRDKDGKLISKGKAARIFSCKLDGSDFRSFCGGGFDNPVEIVFTDEGEMLGTVNLFHHQPRGDCLVHWVYGGVYPRTDFIEQFKGEFHFTGDLLPEVHNFGHVALSGLCRYRSGEIHGDMRVTIKQGTGKYVFDPRTTIRLFLTEFNTHKVKVVDMQKSGATYKTVHIDDFLTASSIDFHPTDVLEDADGSLLVIDTGGWFRIGCPVSQVEKPQAKGAIWRVGRKDAKPLEDPRGLKLLWGDSDVTPDRAQNDHRFVVRDRDKEAIERPFRDIPLGQLDPDHRQETMDIGFDAARANVGFRPRYVSFVLRHKDKTQIPRLLSLLETEDHDPFVHHSIVFALIQLGDAEATSKGLTSDNERVRKGAAIALEQMRRKLTLTDAKSNGIEVPPPHLGTKLTKEELTKLDGLEPSLKRGDAATGRKVFESQKASCTICHRVGDKGAEVSLNLTKIGAIRSERDLLESILYPSATFARGFEPFNITLKDGQIHTGLISREATDAIHLRGPNNQETKVLRSEIEKIEAGKLSIMPGNYGDLLSPQELADLIAYLRSLK